MQPKASGMAGGRSAQGALRVSRETRKELLCRSARSSDLVGVVRPHGNRGRSFRSLTFLRGRGSAGPAGVNDGDEITLIEKRECFNELSLSTKVKGGEMSRTDPTLASNHTLHLHDGRMLGYAEYGASAGTPLFFFHGYPGTRLEAGLLAQAATQAGRRLIGVDRPGMGLSSFQAGRRVLDWPEDVAALASHLAIDRFAVVGFSGGGPYALACAYKMPDRLTACGIVAGMVPPEYGTSGMMARNRLLFFFARRLPWVLSPLMWAMGRSCQEEEQARRSLLRSAPHLVEPDRACVLNRDVGRLLAADMVEAFRQGARGLAYEGSLYGRSWGFRVEDITFPALFLWHGGCDRNIPVAMGRAVADKLAHCQASYSADEGHLSLVVNHAAEIVTILSS